MQGLRRQSLITSRARSLDFSGKHYSLNEGDDLVGQAKRLFSLGKTWLEGTFGVAEASGVWAENFGAWLKTPKGRVKLLAVPHQMLELICLPK